MKDILPYSQTAYQSAHTGYLSTGEPPIQIIVPTSFFFLTVIHLAVALINDKFQSC